MVLSYTSIGGVFVIFGLLGLAVFVFCILPIVLGLMALRQIDRSGGVQRGRGLALCAILLGAIGLLVVPAALLFGGMTARASSARTMGTAVSTTMPAVPSMTISTSGTTVQFGSGGQGGQGGQGGFGGSPGGAGGNGSVLRTPSTATPASGANARGSGSVGEMSIEDTFDSPPATATPPPAATAPTAPKSAPAPAANRNARGSVGEANIDD